MIDNDITPVFIFSLPRSGSTLLQRIIASHPSVHTLSEPWLLLSLLYLDNDNGIFSEYGHKLAAKGINDFIAQLPNGKQDYQDELRHFVTRLYLRSAPGPSKFFIEKTPRNILVADKIVELFPDAKFIFLWRNPISIVSSIIETFSFGKWGLHRNYVDLFEGFDKMYTSFHTHRDNVLSLQYENLINEPTITIKYIADYLELDLSSSSLQYFHEVKLPGRLGDSTGIKNYKTIDKEPLDKWKQTLCNTVRKKWLVEYINWIGQSRLQEIGYDYYELISNLDRLPTSSKFYASDLIRKYYGLMRIFLATDILKKQWIKAFNHRNIHFFN